MSADLFAEFNELSNPPPRDPQKSTSSASKPSHLSRQNTLEFFESTLSKTSNPNQTWLPTQAQFGSLIQNPAENVNFPGPKQTQEATTTTAGDDGWGDFEVAHSEKFKSASGAPGAWDAPVPTTKPTFSTFQDLPKTRPVRASTLDIINNSLVDYGSTPDPETHGSTQRPKSERWRQKPRIKTTPADENVLFDVNDFELQEGEEGEEDEDDEFGDFETVAPARPTPEQRTNPCPNPSSTLSMDLLSLDDPVNFVPPSAVTNQVSSKPLKPLGFGATAASKRAQKPKSVSSLGSEHTTKPSAKTIRSKTIVAKAVVDDGDEWAAWDDYDPSSTNAEEGSKSVEKSGNWDWGTSENAITTSKPLSDNEPPPMNVPPPSVLLSAFPSLFASGDLLFKTASGEGGSIKQKILSDPKAVDFLQGFILLATTAARVIAGRKHRWHRDKILTKSMSISAAGSKGMKLTGIDKSQSIREDREAADVVEVWHNHVGRLRSAVAVANSASRFPLLKIPEMSTTMAIQTVKNVPTAPKACIICGLKRDERVVKVDFDVEDSFGEWWVEHWGHRACKNFWIEHEEHLRQR